MWGQRSRAGTHFGRTASRVLVSHDGVLSERAPEDLVVLTAREAALASGPHRIYLGYAAGVGKTYAMLQEGRWRAGNGEDVVIGFLEPHSRPDTARLAEGLERVAPETLEYREASFQELDVDAVLRRRPRWALIDELAHACVPGSRHAERWQAVEEILAAGIGVISTLNVQHLQGLNDYVFQVAGVRIADTVPDRLLDEAAAISLVDIEPGALIERLKAGQVYDMEVVGRALSHFFSKNTLAALRQQSFSEAARGARSRDGHLSIARSASQTLRG